MTSHRDRRTRAITRREFLHLAGATVTSVLTMSRDVAAHQSVDATAATRSSAQTPTAQSTSPTGAQTYNEAPMLARLVQQGKLPPVDQRLPTNPCVLQALEQTGSYDSLLHRAFKGVSDRWGPLTTGSCGSIKT